MTNYQVLLDDAKEARFQSILALANVAGYTRAAAKSKVDSTPCVVYEGDKWSAERILSELRAAGALCSLRAMPLDHIPHSWAASISDDLTHCRECGSPLFFAVPGLTSESELIEFVTQAAMANKETILRDKWIHPGVYCPNGCGYVLAHLEST